LSKWDKIKSLFQQTVELPPDQRKTFLDKNCKDDQDLRREIESLIEAHYKSETFLEAPPFQITQPETNENSSDQLIGMRIDKYLIEKKIGEGGMSVVYSAVRADEQFKRRVAIKFIKRGMETDEIIKRFKIEQQTLAGLNHSNIARIIDGGAAENGLSYFVMELIEGRRIDTYCKDKELSVTEKLKLFQKVCSAIQYAHQNLVVHRDIKPGNIFVTADGTPKLLDFGIAKLLDSSSEQANLTRTGLRVMTLEYASPEQLMGKQITTATDIYSLGVVLYELLTGYFPYEFKNSFPSEVERVVCTTDPEKPSTAVSRRREKQITAKDGDAFYHEHTSRIDNKNNEKIRHRLSGDIDNIVLKAMQKEPERRYSTVEQFSEDIRRHLEGLPIIARKNSIGYRSKKFFERHRAGTISALIILIVIVLGIIGVIYQAKVAANERDKAQIESLKANKINSFLENMLSSADPYEKGRNVKVVEILDNAVKKIDMGLKGQPEIQAELRTTLGITYQDLGVYNKAQAQLEQALRIRESLYGKNNDETATSMQNLASILYDEGNFQKAKVLYEKAIKIHKKFMKPNDTPLAEALNQYGQLNMEFGKYDMALKFLKASYAMYSKEGKETSNASALINNIALVLDYKGKLDSAESMYRKALSISYKLPGNNDLQIAHETNNLAGVLHEKGDFKDAIELYKKSLAIREKDLGINNPEVGLAICNLGGEVYYVKDYSRSLEKVKESLKIWKKTLPADHPYFAKAYLWLAKNYNEKREPKIAENYLLKALKIEYKKLSGYKFYIAETKCELGRSYFLQKNYTKAKPLLTKNFDIIENKFGEKNIDVVNYARVISNMYLELKEPEKANKYREIVSNAPFSN